MGYEEVFSSELLKNVPEGSYAVLVTFLVGILGVLFLGLALGVVWSKQRGGVAVTPGESDCVKEGVPNGKSDGVEKQHPKSKFKQQPSTKKLALPSHPLLAAEFKGHTGAVLSLDFNTNGKYLASSSDDRTIRLWYMKTLQDKEHKYARRNINLDHATHIKFSPDDTAVIATMSVANTINVYRITKAQKGGVVKLVDTPVEFPKLSSLGVLSLDIASTGKFIMTYSAESFSVWTLKGEELATVPTLQSPNTSAAVSPCGKFVACAGFMSDVKLWEVEFSKNDEFLKVSKAMDLKGHNASVFDVTFSGDSHRMATVSRDATWKFWNVDVQYKKKEDPKLLVTGKVSSCGDALISLAPDSRVVVVAVNMSLFIYTTASGELLQMLDNVHRGVISALCWDPSSLYLVSAGGDDRHIRVWHNTPGMQQLLLDLEARLPKATSEPLKRRILEQMNETRDRLKLIGYIENEFYSVSED